jgi:hypothetical protein
VGTALGLGDALPSAYVWPQHSINLPTRKFHMQKYVILRRKFSSVISSSYAGSCSVVTISIDPVNNFHSHNIISQPWANTCSHRCMQVSSLESQQV